MSLINTTETFGSLTKLLHWTLFVLFILQFYLVYQHGFVAKESPWHDRLIFLHVSFGFVTAIFALLFIFTRIIGKRPIYINTSPFETFLAKAVHFLLYVVMLVQPLSGMMMSLAGGYDVSVFGLFTITAFAQKNEPLSHFLFQVHVWNSYMIIALVSLHALAALFHHFIRRDRVLIRMI